MRYQTKQRSVGVAAVFGLGVLGLVVSSCSSEPEEPAERLGSQRANVISMEAPTTIESGTPSLPRAAKCPGKKLPDQCGSWAGVELSATRTAATKGCAAVEDEHCLCDAVEFQIPAELPVTLGTSGWDWDKAELSFRTTSGREVECQYRGNGSPGKHGVPVGGDKYVFERCSDGSKPGQTKRSDWFELELGKGHPGWGPTQVQLRLGEPDVVDGVVQEQIYYSTDSRIPGAALHLPRGAAPTFETFSLTTLAQVPLGTVIPNADDPATTVSYAVDVHAASTSGFVFSPVPGACARIELPYDQATLNRIAGPGGEPMIQAQQLTTLTGITSGGRVLTSAGPVSVDLARHTFSFCVEHLSFYVATTSSLDSEIVTATLDNGSDFQNLDLLSVSDPLFPGLVPGHAYTLKLGFLNTGGSLWLPANIKLVGVGAPIYPVPPATGTPTVTELAVDGSGNTAWSRPPTTGLGGVNIAHNATANFTLSLVCPATPEPLNFCLRNGTSPTSGYFGRCFSWDVAGASSSGTTPVRQGTPEICDGLDNDLDGTADEGVVHNACGGCGVLAVPTGTPCDNGQSGLCRLTGSYQCTGPNSTACDAPFAVLNHCGGCGVLAVLPATPCSNGQLGPCQRAGTYQCTGPNSTACSAPIVAPSPETCNGVDDNCDGKIDEGVTNIFYADADGDTFGDWFDHDGDGTPEGERIQGCGAPPAGFTLTPGDCCELDIHAHPGVTAFSEITDGCGSFDWDCNGSSERELATIQDDASFCVNIASPAPTGPFCVAGAGTPRPAPADCAGTDNRQSCQIDGPPTSGFSCHFEQVGVVQRCR